MFTALRSVRLVVLLRPETWFYLLPRGDIGFENVWLVAEFWEGGMRGFETMKRDLRTYEFHGARRWKEFRTASTRSPNIDSPPSISSNTVQNRAFCQWVLKESSRTCYIYGAGGFGVHGSGAWGQGNPRGKKECVTPEKRKGAVADLTCSPRSH